MSPLLDFARNVTSQSGEDGIVAEIFNRIGITHSSCVEFGAWDGKYLSNTWTLWYEQQWHAVLIEADAERHARLVESLADFPRVSAIRAFVKAEGDDSLDSILTRCGLQKDFDLLSIDVDGDDYHIWRGMRRFEPRVVIIEYNPTIPPDLELVQREGAYFGASARALVSLASEKGYRLACCTKTNCFFVRNSDWHRLGLRDVALEDVFQRGHLTYVVSSYDGSTYLSRIPTYSGSLSVLTPGATLEEFRASLFPDLSRAETPAVPRDALVPVRVFCFPDRLPEEGLAPRAMRYAWRAFKKSRFAAPARRLGAAWRRWRAHGKASLEGARQGNDAER